MQGNILDQLNQRPKGSAVDFRQDAVPVQYKIDQKASEEATFEQLFQRVRSSNNPMSLLRLIGRFNPQVKQVLDLVDAAGGNGEKVFFEECKKRGVDPQTILSKLGM